MAIKKNTILDAIVYLTAGIILRLSMSFMPGWVTAVVMVIGTLIMIFKFNPEMILLLIILSVPFEVSLDILGKFTVYTTEALILMSCLAWLALLPSGRKIKLPGKKLTVSICVFFGTLLLSWLFTKDLSASVKQTVRWGEVFFVYIFVVNFLNEKTKTKFVVYSIIITGLVTAFIGIYQFFASGFDFREVVSLFGCYDPYAGYLGLIVVMTLTLLVHEKSRLKKPWFGIIFSVLFLTQVATFSRGGWSGLIIAFSVLLILTKPNIRKRLVYIGIAMLTAYILVMAAMPSFFKQPGLPSLSKTERIFSALSNYSVRVRFTYWKAALKSIKEYPLFGIGAGNYQYVHKKYGVTLTSISNGWFGETIVNLEELNPNTNYRVSLEYRVEQGDTGDNDFLELIQFQGTSKRVFQTHYPNVIIFKHNRNWTKLEGTLFTGTSLESLSDVKLRWAHNEKAVVQFRNVKLFRQTGEGELLPVKVDYNYFHLHNLYLQQFVETGIIGLAALLYLLLAHYGFIIKNLLQAKKLSVDNTVSEEGNDYRFVIGLGCLCGVTAFLVHSFVDILFTHSIGVLFGIILGIAVTMGSEITNKRANSSGTLL